MRTLSATLETAQQAMSGRTPYIELIFKKPGESNVDYTTKLKRLVHTEQPYHDYATIVLNNYDLSIVDLTGYYVNVGYGYTTGAGDESSPTSRMWVVQQSNESEPGRLESTLYLVGVWDILAMMSDWGGDPPYLYILYNGQTIYNILDELLTAFNVDLLAIGTQDDGVVNTFIPQGFVVDALLFDGAKAIVYTLMNMTFVYPRLKGYTGTTYIGQIELIYPQEDDDVDYEYYSDQAHYFYQCFWKKNAVRPNDFIVYCNRDPVTGEWTNLITGEYIDQDAIDAFPITASGTAMAVKSFHIAETIDNQGDADNRAEVLYWRNWHEMEWGMAVVPHNCGQELFDKVKVYDSRGLV